MIDSPDLDFTPTRPAGCLTRFRLERYLAGELGESEREQVAQHLQGCVACEALRASLEAGKAEFQAVMPFEEFMRCLTPPPPQRRTALSQKERGEPESLPAYLPPLPTGEGGWGQSAGAGEALSRLRAFLRWLANPAVVGIAAAALALFILVPRLFHGPREGAGSGVDPITGLPDREKGVREPGPLEVVVLRGGQVLAGVSGSVFYEGDRLQFTVHPGSRRYLQLFSVEAGGRVSPFYPDGAQASMHLGPDADQPLAGSIRLDGYVGLERIFALFSDAPIDEQVIEAAVARLGRQQGLPLALDRLTNLPMPGTSQVSFLMVKE